MSTHSPENLDLATFVDELELMLFTGSTGFLDTLKRELSPQRVSTDDVHWWRELHQQMSVLWRNGNYAGMSNQALPLVCNSLALVHEAVWSMQSRNQFEKHKYQQMRDRFQLNISSSKSLDGIMQLLGPTLNRIGIDRAFLVLYDNPKTKPAEEARLVYSFPHNRDAHLNAEPFAAKNVLPIELENELISGLLVLMPLYSSDIQFGYLIVDPTNSIHVNLESMSHSISHALRNCFQIRNLKSHTEQLSKANSELAKIANYDSLTGLPNRTLFQQNLECSFIDAMSNGSEVALLFFDLDEFKVINDTLGHSAGDSLLRIVAKRLKSTLRKADVVARLGGDEFTVILGGVQSTAISAQIAQNLLETLAQPYSLDNRMVNVSASIGIAHYPNDGEDAETLIKNADTAMYHAKSRGKNRYSYYTNDLNDLAVTQLYLDQAMREGLNRGEFSMHYQPRFTLETHELKAFESLMRWKPQSGTHDPENLRPDIFIALAEQTGFIKQLDTFALEQTCKQARLWQDQGIPTTVAVNLSVKQIQQESIVELIATAIERNGVRPQLLELEVTESAAMTDVESNIAKLTELRKMGIQISIDDFGTGYSSINYLKKLPVTSLKIDKSFLQDINENDGGNSPDAAIVKAVVALGRSMDFKLIAEGIETAAQCEFLRSLGCDEAQGFLFSGALEADAATSLLRKKPQRHKAI